MPPLDHPPIPLMSSISIKNPWIGGGGEGEGMPTRDFWGLLDERDRGGGIEEDSLVFIFSSTAE